jgi:hypothetical protein
MAPHGHLKVEPSELEGAANHMAATSKDLGESLRELAGVQHAQNAADSPDVAAALVAMVDAWGTELAGLVVFVSTMADKLQAASTAYVSTDTKAADWARTMPGGRARLAV